MVLQCIFWGGFPFRSDSKSDAVMQRSAERERGRFFF